MVKTAGMMRQPNEKEKSQNEDTREEVGEAIVSERRGWKHWVGELWGENRWWKHAPVGMNVDEKQMHG